jgi:flagellar basal-body rod protein FlgF
MERGLYIAASGMVSEMARQDVIANDLANASTAGYKSDRVVQSSFGDLLLRNTQDGQTIGPLGEGSRIDRQVTDLTAAPIKETGEDLDFAIAGEGYFAVQTAQGTRYTRNGQFHADANGRLVTQTGDPVLGRNNQPITVGADGKVDPRQLNVVLLNTPKKAGDNYVTGTPGAVAGLVPGQVRAGALEDSGADATTAMVDMMQSMRAYESGQKVIQAIDDTLGKAASSVASVSG